MSRICLTKIRNRKNITLRLVGLYRTGVSSFLHFSCSRPKVASVIRPITSPISSAWNVTPEMIDLEEIMGRL